MELLTSRLGFWFWLTGLQKKAHRRPDERVQSSQANSGCLLSRARRVHPVIAGWSTANRPPLPKPINDDPAAAWPRATPGRNWVVLDVAARHRMVVWTESLRIPNRHDTGSTSPRSVGEVALIWDTISHYSPVLIAPLANHPQWRCRGSRIEYRMG